MSSRTMIDRVRSPAHPIGRHSCGVDCGSGGRIVVDQQHPAPPLPLARTAAACAMQCIGIAPVAWELQPKGATAAAKKGTPRGDPQFVSAVSVVSDTARFAKKGETEQKKRMVSERK